MNLPAVYLVVDGLKTKLKRQQCRWYQFSPMQPGEQALALANASPLRATTRADNPGGTFSALHGHESIRCEALVLTLSISYLAQVTCSINCKPGKQQSWLDGGLAPKQAPPHSLLHAAP